MLTGRVALVTGAGRGLGAAHARLLAAAGAAVVVNDVGASLDGLTSGDPVASDLVAEITAAGGRALADISDISAFAGAAAAVERARDVFGRIDILVNNAGIVDTAGVEALTEDALDRVFAVHVRGSVGTTRAAFGHMRAQGFGRIINTISEAALDMRMSDAVAYSSAKAAIWGLTMATAKEGARYGITVNAISPGARTRMSAGVLDAGLSAGLDLAPEHVSRVVTMLASPEAGDITGRVVHAAAGEVREYLLRRSADTDLVRRLLATS
ncbi:SDR family NAD(P)-dependent oxidoreductase [Frankia sp. CiP3]|uniref:SDR family NAD(P)-dependent oxidoreductase n=1 Tax=Frankia sp. CiP3 TaxID=2880971 RepID=UPI001EF579C5|nr:SDR family NAD(P)-dependent oxidoreductase [Frankia sp. CiP3]